MCAFCVPVSLRTTTWAPSATNPPVPAKASPKTSSSIDASTLTSPAPLAPAVTLEPAPMLASVALSTFITRTAAPTPTNPPATEPAMPVTERLSFARTWTPRPATTVLPAWICAEVPAGTCAASASLATFPVGAALVSVVVGARERVATRLFVFASEALFSCQSARS